MPKDNANLAALVGSRLCHDLISPVGAIQNGLELLSLTGMDQSSPEMELIQDSCTSAAARIRFFRVAFGSAGKTQMMSAREVSGTLSDLEKGGRISSDWRLATDLPRTEVQLVFLAYLCCETAIPQGGRIQLDKSDAGWSIAVTGPRLQLIPPLWALLEGGPGPEEITADKVQFAMLSVLIEEQGRKLRVHKGETTLRLELF